MGETDAKPPNPFLAARRLPVVMVSLRADDVMAAAPDLSREQAETLLKDNAAVIAHMMLVAGTAAAACLAKGDDHGN